VELDLGQVRAFVAVVDHGGFGRAATALAISQQGLSKRVARLEGRLGPLLERRPGGIRVTPAGERLLPLARRLLDLADQAVAQVGGAPPAPLRVDVWGELHSPAQTLRVIVAEQPDLAIEFSARRDLAAAVRALERHELDLAFGNAALLADPLPADLTAELVMADEIAVLVSARSALAGRGHVTPADLVRSGIWWPMVGSSHELRAFSENYARSIGAELVAESTNTGLDTLVRRVADDASLVAPVVATWPLGQRTDVRVVPLRPAPHYPWYAVWRTGSRHPILGRLLGALRRVSA
jgi:DNA-binding transcriptional LysR family regulator